MYWIINEFIEFRPASKKLISRRNPELNVVLTSPASRCLLLLLEASPDVVSQQELFKKVWEDEGMYVPTNTLYQNISIVRRGLKAVGETEQTLIATIPRKGFKIEQGVKIVRMASDELFPEEEQEEEQTGNAEELLLPVNEHQQPRISLMSRLSLVFIMLLAFIVGATGMHFYWHSGEPSPFSRTTNCSSKRMVVISMLKMTAMMVTIILRESKRSSPVPDWIVKNTPGFIFHSQKPIQGWQY